MSFDANQVHIFDANQENFEAEVLQASLTIPILVDFWATWCGPCKTLGPLLEKLVGEYQGGFRLAKIDVDQNRELAAMFGVRSVPTVVLVKDRQWLDGFSGTLPEGQLRAFLDQHITTLATDTADASTESAAISPAERVTQLQAELAADPQREELTLELAEALLQQGATADIPVLLDSLPIQLANDPRVSRIRAGLELATALEGAPDEAALQARIAADPQDWPAHDLLALRQYFAGAPAQAFDRWLSVLKTAGDWNDGLARTRLLAAFALSDNPELVGRYRRQLSSLLF